jgi:hypothetical protein
MDASSNIPLKVPFNEKDQAKALGARWNAESKHWYVPQGVDAAPFEKWLVAGGALAQSSAKSVDAKPVQAKPARQEKPNSAAPFDDDMDDINAKLRDAYESFEDRY